MLVKFQFLIGKIQTAFTIFSWIVATLFQFLIGKIQTQVLFVVFLFLFYSFNSLQVRYKPKRVGLFVQCWMKFQFLIGKIQTSGRSFSLLIPPRQFQFLIGKIQTFYIRFNVIKVGMFQFLIGKIQTSSSTMDSSCTSGVSIPYR